MELNCEIFSFLDVFAQKKLIGLGSALPKIFESKLKKKLEFENFVSNVLEKINFIKSF